MTVDTTNVDGASRATDVTNRSAGPSVKPASERYSAVISVAKDTLDIAVKIGTVTVALLLTFFPAHFLYTISFRR